MESTIEDSPEPVYLIYDGDCLLCRNSARVVKIRESIGSLLLINAREQHPMVQEAKQEGYDLNEGILIKYRQQYYFGADAIHFLALVGSPNDLFNKINAHIFKFKWIAYCLYPFMKCIRNFLLFIQKTPPI